MGWGYYEFREYVPVAKKKANALKHATAVAKKQGRTLSPVTIQGRKIAKTFWGTAWCDNLEAYSDYANRLPRGATYVRNGSVVDLVIKPRKIEAIVAGSEVYTVTIEIAELNKATWATIKQDSSTSIDSLLDLLAGRFSDGVMRRLTRQDGGLFPTPKEIKLKCSCPDSSYCCKHLAAVMYGVGARLDNQPELLFQLRNVDPQELVSQAVAEGNLEKELGQDQSSLAGQDLGAIFGIELESTPEKPKRKPRAAPKAKAVAEAPPARPSTPIKASKPRTRKLAAAEAVVVPTNEGLSQVSKSAKRRVSTAKPIVANKATTSRGSTKQVAAKGSKTTVAKTKKPVAARSRLRLPK